MQITANRRGFLTGMVALITAPAIVKIQNIMPVKAIEVAQPNFYIGRTVLSVLRPEGWADIGDVESLGMVHSIQWNDDLRGIRKRPYDLLDFNIANPKDALTHEITTYRLHHDGNTHEFDGVTVSSRVTLAEFEPSRMEARISMLPSTLRRL